MCVSCLNLVIICWRLKNLRKIKWTNIFNILNIHTENKSCSNSDLYGLEIMLFWNVGNFKRARWKYCTGGQGGILPYATSGYKTKWMMVATFVGLSCPSINTHGVFSFGFCGRIFQLSIKTGVKNALWVYTKSPSV